MSKTIKDFHREEILREQSKRLVKINNKLFIFTGAKISDEEAINDYLFKLDQSRQKKENNGKSRNEITKKMQWEQ